MCSERRKSQILLRAKFSGFLMKQWKISIPNAKQKYK